MRPSRAAESPALPQSSVAANTPKGKVIHTLLAGGCALFAAHTNADSARPGVSDKLAELVGITPGTWAVVVTNPDATTATLADGFVVEAGGAPILWAEPVVRRRFRLGTPTTVLLAYGNRGSIDAYGVPLWLSFPDDFTSALRFLVAPPPTHAGQPATDWTRVGITWAFQTSL